MKKITNRLAAAVLSAPMLFGQVTTLIGSAAWAQSAPVEEFRPGFLPGYLHQESLPNALALIPPAPAQDSTAFAWEHDVNQKIQALRGGLRRELATLDNDLTFPNAAGTFSCALRATTVAIPKSDALFRSDLANATAEVAAIRARGLPPTRDCAVEAQTMSAAIPR